jgi:hypothetical protein
MDIRPFNPILGVAPPTPADLVKGVGVLPKTDCSFRIKPNLKNPKAMNTPCNDSLDTICSPLPRVAEASMTHP